MGVYSGGRRYERDSQLFPAIAAGLLYAAASISMNFINKATLMHFNLPNTLLLLQMVSALCIVLPLREARVVGSFTLCLQKAWVLLPVTLLYTANVGFALLSLGTLNIPMYNALKRLTPVMILVVKSAMSCSLPPWQVAGSVVLIVSGCVVAALGDFTFDPAGYCYALASCGLQTSYLLLVERTGVEKGVGTTELLVYNALLSLPFIALIVALQGEHRDVLHVFAAGVERVGLLGTASLILFCSVAGVVLNFSLFWCTQLNSALTTTIIGVLKGVMATVLGYWLPLGGVQRLHYLNVSGIAVNMVGGIWYTAVKYSQRRQQLDRRPGAAASAAPTPVPAGDYEAGGGKALSGSPIGFVNSTHVRGRSASCHEDLLLQGYERLSGGGPTRV